MCTIFDTQVKLLLSTLYDIKYNHLVPCISVSTLLLTFVEFLKDISMRNEV